jgi:hypothetical protein
MYLYFIISKIFPYSPIIIIIIITNTRKEFLRVVQYVLDAWQK